MKTLQLILGIILFSITTSNAQTGYGGGGGYGNNGYGSSGRLNRTSIGPSSNDSKPSKKEIDKNREESVQKTVDKLKKDLNLDELQLIVVTKVVTESQKNQNSIIAKKDSQENKIAELQASMENTDRQIMEFLDKEQKAKYTLLIEERKSNFERIRRQ